MRAAAPAPVRIPAVPLGLSCAALTALSVAIVAGTNPLAAAATLVVVVLLAVGHHVILRWQSLLALMILVILFIPMRRYTLPGSLPFELDPYRVIVLFVLGGWIASLLADQRVSPPPKRLRSTTRAHPRVDRRLDPHEQHQGHGGGI